MPSLPNPLKIATKGAEIGFQVGSFVAGQAFQRVQSLVGGDSDSSKNGDATYSPTPQPKREDSPQERSPQPPKLEAVKTAGETSTGSKPTTSSSTATGPGGTNRMAPKAPKAPAKKPAGTRAKSSGGGSKTTAGGGGGATNASVGGGGASGTSTGKEITAKPATRGTKGETDTTVKATSRTGARSAGGRIANPKAAAKARKRNAGAAPKVGAGAGAGQSPGAPTAAARTGDLSKAKGKGGRPATVKAENSPMELAASKTGKQSAPLGGDGDAS
jgi:hypothetical protein